MTGVQTCALPIWIGFPWSPQLVRRTLASAGATLAFGAGTHTVNGTVGGAGTINVNSGTASFNAAQTIANLSLSGTAGVLVGAGIGMGIGTATVLGVLCASASYIAAPAAVRLALPEANPGVYLAASLGMTFPFNLVVGIPLYLAIAETVIG